MASDLELIALAMAILTGCVAYFGYRILRVLERIADREKGDRDDG